MRNVFLKTEDLINFISFDRNGKLPSINQTYRYVSNRLRNENKQDN